MNGKDMLPFDEIIVFLSDGVFIPFYFYGF